MQCPICSTKDVEIFQKFGDSIQGACFECGIFSISGTSAQLMRNNPLSISEISKFRKWFNENPDVLMESDDVNQLRGC
jgi:uncharacterized Zn finger protein